MAKMDERLFGMGLAVPDIDYRAIAKSKFIMSPFTALSARDKDWRDRRAAWRSLGIQSELGREGVKAMTNIPYRTVGESETSIFDPVLCELMYTWHTPPGGQIIDPFAGGSVRGLVASCLGFKYWGCDLSARQIAANKAQVGDHNTGPHKPIWIQGDSLEKMQDAPEADFLFSCPPYGSLEKYSNHPADISNMPYKDFLRIYRDIIWYSCDRLKDRAFACFVVANFRENSATCLSDLVGDTTRAFARAGLGLYSDAILITPIGSAAVRCTNTFERGNRKMLKVHQNVLVFLKGEPPDVSKWEKS